jgi:hypothetical protein
MTRPHTAQLDQVLLGSFSLAYTADLFYNGTRRFEGLPITEPSFGWDASAEVEGSARCKVAWTDDQGSSLKPNDPQDWLAPFGARLVVYAVVSVGDWFERVQLGDYDITAVPSANDSVFMFGETRITVGSVVELQLKDRMVEVQRDRFVRLAQAPAGASVWGEVASITGLPVTRSLTDATINRAVVYEESRVSAVQDLLSILDGVPFMEWDGTLSARPRTAPAAGGTLRIGESGTITQIGSSLDAEGVSNGVVIRAETDGQQQVLAEKWVESGPLRATVPGQPRTPYHRVPRFYSNPQITTAQQAQAVIGGLLTQWSQPRASELQVQCVTDPTLQLGDVRRVVESSFTWTIRVTKIDLGDAPTMTINGDVLDRVANVN